MPHTWTWPEATAAVAGSVAIAGALTLGSLWVFGPKHDREIIVPRGYITTLQPPHPHLHIKTSFVYAPAPPPVTHTIYRPGAVRTVVVKEHGKPYPVPGPTVTVTVHAPPAPPPSSP
jgi:hypothetical protein